MILRSFFGSIVFEAIGAFVRWVYLRIRGGKVDFSEVWRGRENLKFHESMGQGVSNIALGIGTVLLIVIILKLIGV